MHQLVFRTLNFWSVHRTPHRFIWQRHWLPSKFVPIPFAQLNVCTPQDALIWMRLGNLECLKPILVMQRIIPTCATIPWIFLRAVSVSGTWTVTETVFSIITSSNTLHSKTELVQLLTKKSALKKKKQHLMPQNMDIVRWCVRTAATDK